MNELQTITKGLPELKAKVVTDTLSLFFDKAGEWQSKVSSLVITKPDQLGEMKMAREGRLYLKNMRVQADKTIKDVRTAIKNRMADDIAEDKLWLRAGQMIETTFKKLESDLEEKEKFGERYLAQVQEKQRAERLDLIRPFDLGIMNLDSFSFGTMSSEQFDTTLSLFKRNFELAQEEAERKQKEEQQKEAERLAEEERIRKENEELRIKAEAEEAKSRQAQEELRKVNEANAEKERIRKEKEAKAEAERIAKKKTEDARIAKENEAKVKAEREHKEKAEAELKAIKEANRIAAEKKEAEAKEKAAAAAKAALAPDKEKLKEWISKMSIPPLFVNDEKAVKAYTDISTKFRGFKNWATQEIDKI